MAALVINTLEINFDKKANVHVTYRYHGQDQVVGETHSTVTHKAALEVAAKTDYFLFRIDPLKAPAARKRLISKIEKLGFEVGDSGAVHYLLEASK